VQWAPFQGLVYLHLLLKGLQLENESRPRSAPRMRQPGHGILR
jgi:hypothetical protein